MAQIRTHRRRAGRTKTSTHGGPLALKTGILIIGCLVSVICYLSASDRITASSVHPTIAYFGGRASGQIAAIRLSKNQVGMASAAAARFVRSDPIDPAAASTLGAVWLVQGQPQRAYSAFRVSGSLGWRDIPTQLYWLQTANEMGDVELVAQHMDALLRLNVHNRAVDDTLLALDRSEVGQNALIDLLRQNPPWEDQFLLESGDLSGSELDARIMVLKSAVLNGVNLNCNAIANAVKHLILNDDFVRAKVLWQDTCDDQEGQYLFNGNFESVRQFTYSSPFSWNLVSTGGLDVGIRPAPAPLTGHALSVDSQLTVRTPVATQTVVLPVGRYRMAWRTTTGSGLPDPSLTVALLCNNARTLLPVVSDRAFNSDPTRSAVTFDIRSNCPLQTVIVQKAAVDPDNDKPGWIDDISISLIT